MPHDLYASCVEEVRRLVRSVGKRPLGRQESARAGLGADDIIQYWCTEIALAASLPQEVRAQAEANLALSRADVETAVAASVPVIVSLSHCYFDVPSPSRPPTTRGRYARLAPPISVAHSLF